MKEASSDRGSVSQHQSFIQERLTEANKQKEELEEQMRLWREQHDDIASAVSKSSIPAGVEVHSMAKGKNP